LLSKLLKRGYYEHHRKHYGGAEQLGARRPMRMGDGKALAEPIEVRILAIRIADPSPHR
jgi:hypothetical protein